jgi:dihydroxy-acid dehydratase
MRSDRVKKGIERAGHRSLFRATGISDADLKKPLIAICSSHVDIIPGHVHLDKVANYVKECVKEAGGTPFIFNTMGICDGIAMGHTGMKYSLPSREIIADTVESMLQAHCFDGVVCIPNCDKIIPGMLMGVMRVNIPAIFVSGGPMEAGRMPDGRAVDLISVFAGVGALQVGKISKSELTAMEEHACPSCGSCSGMFTANSMNCLTEALGIALPGNGTLLAVSAERKKLYCRAAHRIVEMVKQFEKKGAGHGLLPREICTRESIDNSMILDMAMGGSTNTLLHILAVARDAGVKYDMRRINELSRKTPNICKVSPSCAYHIEDVHQSGGIHTILGEIARGRKGLLHLDCSTVTGKTIGKNIAEWDIRGKKACTDALEMAAVGASGKLQTPAMSLKTKPSSLRAMRNQSSTMLSTQPARQNRRAASALSTQHCLDPFDCIRTCDKAYSQVGGLSILYGNIARDGAVVKTAGVKPQMLVHSGPAVIFESQEDACAGILGGKVKAGDVVVIRNEGPKGGPGMQEMLSPTSYLVGMGLDDKCALITDGRFSGGTAGACIGHVSPEAAAGGAIGLLRNGDIIEIDIPGHKLSARLSDAEIAKRRKTWKEPEPRFKTGYLARYIRQATSANTGAVLEA